MNRSVPPREAPIVPARTALLVIDVQKGILNEQAARERPYFYRSATEVVVPNLRRLLAAARGAGSEVVFTVIQSLTRDGRDRSLDYKLTGFHFPPGSEAAAVLDELAPEPDELVLPKTSSSVFNSTTFAYLMRNIGIDTVVATGFLTDQCVDHTVRDGADLGFQMVCPIDACTTDTAGRHEAALAAFRGYGRQVTTDQLVQEWQGRPG